MGTYLNPRQSKRFTEQIFDDLCPNSNDVKSLMTGNSQNRMNFLADKISDQIMVTILNYIYIHKNLLLVLCGNEFIDF